MSEATCPFCGEPAVRRRIGGITVFRCGTEGPDAAGEYRTGYICDIATFTREIERLKAENQRLSEGPQLRVNVEALVDDVERLTAELDALRHFVEKHARTSGHKMDGTAQYRMTGAIGRARSLWDAINRAENKTEMGDE